MARSVPPASAFICGENFWLADASGRRAAFRDGKWRPVARSRRGVRWRGALPGAVSGGIRCAFPPYAVKAEWVWGRGDRLGEPFARHLVPTLVRFAAQALSGRGVGRI